jgi:hypothetical protein
MHAIEHVSYHRPMAKADRQLNVMVREVVLSVGNKTEYIKVNIDGTDVRIQVAPEVKAYFAEQFVREAPTPRQKKKFATVMNLLRAAYLQGRADASQ